MNVNLLHYNLVKAAEHMAEASRYLRIVDEERALMLLQEAEFLLSIMNVEEEKVSDERLEEVLGEILGDDKSEK